MGLVALLALAPPASGDWQPMPVPGGHVQDVGVADADTWLVQTGPLAPDFSFTENGGASWVPAQIVDFPSARLVGAAADGSFRVLAWRESALGSYELQVFRVGAGGVVTPLGPAIADVGFSIFSAAAAVSEDGTTWVPFEDTVAGAHKLAAIAGDGALVTTILPGTATTSYWQAEKTAFGLRLLRYGPEGSFSPVFKETYRLDGTGQAVPAERYPVSLVDGEFWFSSMGRASWDGGAHWSETGLHDAIPRAPSPGGMPRFLGGGRQVAERYSPFLFRWTGLQWPGKFWLGIVDAGGALVSWSEDSIYVHAGALPPPPAAIGALEADTLNMLARANLFRADAGLPPLTGDAAISQASRNHSRYLFLNPEQKDFHNETPGRAGFTGEGPGARCDALGATCSSEVVYSAGQPDPVGGWLATPFHRNLPGSPQTRVVGAARVEGGASVMNSHFAGQNVLIRPFGYPHGLWRGDAGFSGEVPDPVKICQELGHSIEYPIGIAVTLYTPVEEGEVKAIEVRRGENGAALPGCLLSNVDVDGDATGTFVLDDPLEPGQAYGVRATWNPGPEMRVGGVAVPAADLTYEWSFAFHPDGYAERSALRRHRSKRCLGRRATMEGTGKRDVLEGTRRPDAIVGLGGNDVIRGLGRGDRICGGDGRDRIFGGKGGDRLSGGKGRDRLYGGPGVDQLWGGRGRDLLRGGGRRNVVRQ